MTYSLVVTSSFIPSQQLGSYLSSRCLNLSPFPACSIALRRWFRSTDGYTIRKDPVSHIGVKNSTGWDVNCPTFNVGWILYSVCSFQKENLEVSMRTYKPGVSVGAYIPFDIQKGLFIERLLCHWTSDSIYLSLELA